MMVNKECLREEWYRVFHEMDAYNDLTSHPKRSPSFRTRAIEQPIVVTQNVRNQTKE